MQVILRFAAEWDKWQKPFADKLNPGKLLLTLVKKKLNYEY